MIQTSPCNLINNEVAMEVLTLNDLPQSEYTLFVCLIISDVDLLAGKILNY